MPYHIRAERVSERVIVVGDPGRASLISKLLEDARLVNENRGLLTYNGYWRGKEVTVATHGMGGSGATIVFEELIQLGGRILVRYGTTGGIREDVEPGDFVVPVSAFYHPGGLFKQYFGDVCVAPAPDLEVTWRLSEALRGMGLRVWTAPVVSSDAFYAETPEVVKRWSGFGAVSVEMECASLFAVSRLRGVRSSAVLLVNGNLLFPGKRMISEAELEERLVSGAKVILDVLVKVG
ncbi:MAG: purine-nucleoside phosphorylase [Thermofilum sp.]|jgi:5'-methylthioadenosine phosphorylase|nr:purine-nucleoside phosphorylase [Thermofilum sp.]